MIIVIWPFGKGENSVDSEERKVVFTSQYDNADEQYWLRSSGRYRSHINLIKHGIQRGDKRSKWHLREREDGRSEERERVSRTHGDRTGIGRWGDCVGMAHGITNEVDQWRESIELLDFTLSFIRTNESYRAKKWSRIIQSMNATDQSPINGLRYIGISKINRKMPNVSA